MPINKYYTSRLKALADDIWHSEKTTQEQKDALSGIRRYLGATSEVEITLYTENADHAEILSMLGITPIEGKSTDEEEVTYKNGFSKSYSNLFGWWRS